MLATALLEQGAQSTIVDVVSKCDHGDFYSCVDLLNHQTYTIYSQNLDMKDEIPTRFSKRLFDRYAPFIGAALDAYPKPITIESTLSPRTVQRCLEEALSAKRQYKHQNPAINEELWRQFGPIIGTADMNGRIRIGSRQVLRLPSESPGSAPIVPEYAVVATESALRALAQLLSSNALIPKPLFFVRGTDVTLRTILEKQFDVAFVPDDNDVTKHYIS